MENLESSGKAQFAGQRPAYNSPFRSSSSRISSRGSTFVEQIGNCPTDQRATDNLAAHKCKMLRPGLRLRIENRHERAGLSGSMAERFGPLKRLQ